MTKNKNSKNGKNSHGYLQAEIDEYKAETGKNAIVAGKATKAFKQFVEEMESEISEEEIEIPEEIEEEEISEEDLFGGDEEEEEEEEVAETPKKPKKAKKEKPKVDTTQIEAELQGLRDFREQIEFYVESVKLFQEATEQLPEVVPEGLKSKIGTTQLNKLHVWGLSVLNTSQKKLFGTLDGAISRLESKLNK